MKEPHIKRAKRILKKNGMRERHGWRGIVGGLEKIVGHHGPLEGDLPTYHKGYWRHRGKRLVEMVENRIYNDPNVIQAKRREEKRREKRVANFCDEFYKSYPWKSARVKALENANYQCERCSSSAQSGATLDVSHITPIEHDWGARLNPENIQVLCYACKDWEPKKENDLNYKAFYKSFDWRSLRVQILERDGYRCVYCGASPQSGTVLNVDHIKPLKKRWDLRLDPGNLQVLCAECNHGKANKILKGPRHSS